MIGNFFFQSWLIWATFHTTGKHFFHQKFPLLSSDLKNVLTKDFPMQPFANVLQIRRYCKFPDNHKKYLCWSLFLIHALIKLQDWWPATLLKKRSQHRCFPVNILKCLKKLFVEHLRWLLLKMVFLNISKNFYRRSYMEQFVWFNQPERKLRNLGNFLHWKVNDIILKRSDEFYLFRFVWRD